MRRVSSDNSPNIAMNSHRSGKKSFLVNNIFDIITSLTWKISFGYKSNKR